MLTMQELNESELLIEKEIADQRSAGSSNLSRISYLVKYATDPQTELAKSLRFTSDITKWPAGDTQWDILYANATNGKINTTSPQKGYVIKTTGPWGLNNANFEGYYIKLNDSVIDTSKNSDKEHKIIKFKNGFSIDQSSFTLVEDEGQASIISEEDLNTFLNKLNQGIKHAAQAGSSDNNANKYGVTNESGVESTQVNIAPDKNTSAQITPDFVLALYSYRESGNNITENTSDQQVMDAFIERTGGPDSSAAKMLSNNAKITKKVTNLDWRNVETNATAQNTLSAKTKTLRNVLLKNNIIPEAEWKKSPEEQLLAVSLVLNGVFDQVDINTAVGHVRKLISTKVAKQFCDIKDVSKDIAAKIPGDETQKQLILAQNMLFYIDGSKSNINTLGLTDSDTFAPLTVDEVIAKPESIKIRNDDQLQQIGKQILPEYDNGHDSEIDANKENKYYLVDKLNTTTIWSNALEQSSTESNGITKISLSGSIEKLMETSNIYIVATNRDPGGAPKDSEIITLQNAVKNAANTEIMKNGKVGDLTWENVTIKAEVTIEGENKQVTALTLESSQSKDEVKDEEENKEKEAKQNKPVTESIAEQVLLNYISSLNIQNFEDPQTIKSKFSLDSKNEETFKKAVEEIISHAEEWKVDPEKNSMDASLIPDDSTVKKLITGLTSMNKAKISNTLDTSAKLKNLNLSDPKDSVALSMPISTVQDLLTKIAAEISPADSSKINEPTGARHLTADQKYNLYHKYANDLSKIVVWLNAAMQKTNPARNKK